MFDNMKNMASMLSQAKQMQEQMKQLQDELARRTVEADAGAGAVRVTMNGKFQVLRVQLDPALLSAFAGAGAQADQRMVEDLIAAAFNAALLKSQEMAAQEMSRITGGLDLGAIGKMLGG
jgi:DNA-binding YbaB/EbfC family protein